MDGEKETTKMSVKRLPGMLGLSSPAAMVDAPERVVNMTVDHLCVIPLLQKDDVTISSHAYHTRTDPTFSSKNPQCHYDLILLHYDLISYL